MILITGSEGFIGSYLMKYLKKNAYHVKGIDKKNGKEVLDITVKDLIEIDCVIHLAAQTSVWNDNIEEIERDNIRSFIHIFNLCKRLNIQFIYASSSCSINVTSMYGLTKQFNDGYANIYGWDKCVGLRFHNVYGANARKDTLVGICLNNDEVTLYNNGNNLRHFTYIEDVAKAIIKALALPGGTYNVYNEETLSTYKVCNIISKYKPLKINIVSKIREYDKEWQAIDTSNINLLEKNATPFEQAIANIFKG